MLKKLLVISFICAVLSTLTAKAAEGDSGSSFYPRPHAASGAELKPSIGLFTGFVAPEGRGNSEGEYGLDIGFQPYVPFGVGIEYNHIRLDNGTVAKETNQLWLRGNYNFGGDVAVIRDSYIGLELGAVLRDDGTSAAVAPMIGFDIPLGNHASSETERHFSLGANAKYAFVADGQTDAFSLNGIVKYWY